MVVQQQRGKIRERRRKRNICRSSEKALVKRRRLPMVGS
jgi:hypothetical protein